LLNIDGKNILLDCGIRMNGGKDSLPDFRLIQENGGVDAILISHAHLDHTGSLPVISREYPEAPIYMTHPTKDLVRVLLYDSLKIMEQSEGEIPIYAPKHVEAMLGKVVCFSPEYFFEPFGSGQIRIAFYHAGHIVGASSIYIQGKEGSFFYSGDISVVNQQTVGGASLPKLRPDAALMESTYGNRLHANRDVEEERLIQSVHKVIEDGGKMLIPAFALGRAQEIILILKRAMNKGTIPKFKIFIDGMVREICRVYRLNPNYLRPSLAKKIWRDKDIFFDDWIEPVISKEMREEIIAQSDPCCIISSSGMLTGGPSQWYAEKLAADEKNFIAITGYQDEEAPGRYILELMDNPEEERWLEIGERKIPLKCGIGKYGLSAHADRDEIIGLVHLITPKEVFLVHGDQQAMQELGKHMQVDIRGKVFLAENGETHEIHVERARKQLYVASVPSMNRTGVPSSQEEMKELWQHIMDLDLNVMNHVYSAEELLQIWMGGLYPAEDEVRKLIELLNDSFYFQPDYRRPFLFRPLSYEAVEEHFKQMEGPMEVNQMMALVDKYFPPQTGLYKKGAKFNEKVVLLYFKFPVVAKERYKNKFEQFEEETGWKVELNQNCNLEAAENLLISLLPPGAEFDGKLSYYREEGYFKTSLKGIQNPELIQDEFKKETGLELRLNKDEGQYMPPVSAREGQMEQNKAFELIEQTFADKGVKIYKKSLKQDEKGPYIEVSFISPEIGKKWDELLMQLEKITWWDIRISTNPNQNEIMKLARRLLEGAGLYLKKNPGFFQIEKMVKVVPAGEWDQEIFHEIQKKFKSETGYDLSL
jgi:Cft2 family RNA processing exonuclease